MGDTSLALKTTVDAYEALRKDKELWDQFIRKKEYFSQDLDRHGRYIHDKDDFDCVTIPKVSEFLIEHGMRPEYPDGHGYAICLTHDVDDVYPPLSHLLLSTPYLLKELNFARMKQFLLWRIKRKEDSPYWNFKDIIELEDSFDATSTFYFLSTNRDLRRFRYEIEDLEVEIGDIQDLGWDIGLHGGYYSFNSVVEMKNEKKRLEKTTNRKIDGYRGHYLRFSVPNTWKNLKDAGFKYDSTFGYNDLAGFRNQTCFPFKPYDITEDKSIDIMEIPLNLADMTLFGMDSKSAWKVSKELMDVTKKQNGVLTLLWHNNVFASPFRFRFQKIYHKILEYGRSTGAWMTSADDIWTLWNEYVH